MLSLRTQRKSQIRPRSARNSQKKASASQKSTKESVWSGKDSQGREKASLLSEDPKTSVIIPLESHGDWPTEVFAQPPRATRARRNTLKPVRQSAPSIVAPFSKEELAEIQKTNFELQKKLDELALLLQS